MTDYIKAAAALIVMLKDLMDWIKEVSKGNPAKWINDTSAAIAQLKQAKTPEEKLNAAKKIQDIFGSI